MDWTIERTISEWTFREVEFPTMQELGTVDFITGGSGQLSALNDMKMTGTLEADGWVPNELNLIRVYYRCENVLGEKSGLIPWATFFVSEPEPTSRATSDGQRVSGQIQCTSTLSLLQKKLLHAPLPVPKGTHALTVCEGLISELNLPYKVIDESGYLKGRDKEYEEGTSYLEVINDLLDLAGFRAVYPDEYGTIILEKYKQPLTTESVYSFERGANAIHMREIPFSSNYRDTPTTMIGSYSSETYKIISVIDNVDPDSPSSLRNRGGIRNEEFFQIEELSETTKENQIIEVERKTLSRLKANSSSIEHYEIKHLWIPQVRPNKVITLKDEGVDFRGAITNVTVNFNPSAICTTKFRDIVRYELITDPDTSENTGDSCTFYGDFLEEEASE